MKRGEDPKPKTNRISGGGGGRTDLMRTSSAPAVRVVSRQRLVRTHDACDFDFFWP